MTPKPLTSASGENLHPDWSPDGRWITFQSDRTEKREIFVMESRGEAFGVYQVTQNNDNDLSPTWNTDGTQIIFESERSRDIFAASNLAFLVDSDGDLVPDIADACPGLAPEAGEIDVDFDGCPDATSSFRTSHFWNSDQQPILYELDAALDPRITDNSDLVAIHNGFQSWTD